MCLRGDLEVILTMQIEKKTNQKTMYTPHSCVYPGLHHCWETFGMKSGFILNPAYQPESQGHRRFRGANCRVCTYHADWRATGLQFMNSTRQKEQTITGEREMCRARTVKPRKHRDVFTILIFIAVVVVAVVVALVRLQI